MPNHENTVEDLTALNQIITSLNQAVDVRGALDSALERLLEVMNLETGWIFLRDETSQDRWSGRGYILASIRNPPPALYLDNPAAWDKGCDCQGFCDKGKLEEAYNEVHCSRLSEAKGDRRGLVVHASTPLRSADRTLGILNVAANDWSAFSPRSLAFLTNVGNQMGLTLERARLYDMIHERRIEEQRILLNLSNQLLRQRDLQALLDHLVAEIPPLLGVEAAAILLYSGASRNLKAFASFGWQDNDEEISLSLPSFIQDGLERLVVSGQVQAIADLDQGIHALELKTWFREQGVRSLALAPLVAAEVQHGILLLVCRFTWTLDDNEKRFLRLLANQAAIAIESAKLMQAALAQQRLEAELETARQIQQSLQPKRLPEIQGWQFAVYDRPARQVGGDFYDVFPLPEQSRWGWVIADVVDKGVPAALVMALSRTLFRSTAISDRSPADVMARVNILMRYDSGRYQVDEDGAPDEIFVSAVYAVLDPISGRLSYANAGHPRPLWLRAGRGVEALPARGIVLGLMDEIQVEEHQIDIAPGDALVLCTDGVTEAMDAGGGQFGESRLSEVIADNGGEHAQAILNAIIAQVESFVAEDTQMDDLTVVVIRRAPGDL